ncbi:MAG: hypothetical protein NDJ18_07190, partial [candidate division Zixibacteria bacterium]|nr:hypothetical protein [candidate division Zixibacteria bacterium]
HTPRRTVSSDHSYLDVDCDSLRGHSSPIGGTYLPAVNQRERLNWSKIKMEAGRATETIVHGVSYGERCVGS